MLDGGLFGAGVFRQFIGDALNELDGECQILKIYNIIYQKISANFSLEMSPSHSVAI